MARKGGFLKGIVASAATYAVKTAVDIAFNPENMQKVTQLVSDRRVGGESSSSRRECDLPAALSPSSQVAQQLDAIEDALAQYADQFPANAIVEQWKSTLRNLRLMDTMNKSTTGSEHKSRLEKLQTRRPRPCSTRFSSPLTRATPRSKADRLIAARPCHSQAHRRVCRLYTAAKWI